MSVALRAIARNKPDAFQAGYDARMRGRSLIVVPVPMAHTRDYKDWRAGWETADRVMEKRDGTEKAR